MEKLTNKPTQEQRILEVLVEAEGGWVSYQYFVRTMMITQAHARIFSLQKKGYKIEASKDTDSYGFKYYRLVRENLFDK